MKRVIVVAMVIMLMLCEYVCAEGIGTQIDGEALEWYARTEAASYKNDGLPIDVWASELDGEWVLVAYCDVDAEHGLTIEETLTAFIPPREFSMVYYSFDNSVTFFFERSIVTEIPESVEVYADGKLIKGKVNVSPEEVDAESRTVGFYFTLEEIKRILDADDVFMRLKTDKGISFFEMSEESMLSQYLMLYSVYFGARYSLVDDVCYLEQGILAEEYRNWQIINDPISGVTFPVTDSWSSEVLNQTNDHFAVRISQIGDDEYQLIIYVSADILSLIDENTRQYVEQSGVTRSEMDKIYFVPDCMSSIAGVSKEELVLQEYAGKQYYGYKIQLDTDIGWGVIGLHNGYVLNISCVASGATESDIQGLVESFLNTFQFP